ncbi:hypothetical protein J6Y73_05005, partial [bacterium]|nr:hypothetical protein [bacterium]
PSTWTQGAPLPAGKTLSDLFYELVGTYYVEPYTENGVVKYPTMTEEEAATNAKWDAYMNALTWSQLAQYYTGAKGPVTNTGLTGSDGPVTFGGGADWSTCPITASTFNIELVEQQGEMLGTQAMLNNTRGWRGGGIDTHRTAFNGRCFEYYSEDGVLAAKIAVAVDKGVTSKGIMCYWKHYFCNDQEYRRANVGGVSVFATEQTLREIYMRPFEAVVKNGTVGVMTSFNRLGFIVNTNNYASHQWLMHDQWGYRGGTVNDQWAKSYVSQDLSIRAGDTYLMGSWNGYGPTGFTYGVWVAGDRDGKGMVYTPIEGQNQNVNNISDMTKAQPAPSHYYAMRLAAIRDIHNEVNSMCVRNNMAKGIELTGQVYQGIGGNVSLSCAETSNFTVTGVTFPTDLTRLAKANYAAIEPNITSSGSGTRITYTYTYIVQAAQAAQEAQPAIEDDPETPDVDESRPAVPAQEAKPEIKVVKRYRQGQNPTTNDAAIVQDIVWTYFDHTITENYNNNAENALSSTVYATNAQHEYPNLQLTVNADGSRTYRYANGITVNGTTGVVNLPNNLAIGEYEVNLTVTADFWVTNVPAKATIKVVSPLTVNGEEIDSLTINYTSGMVFSSNYYGYGSKNTSFFVFGAYNVNNQGWMQRKEDETAADIVTYDYAKEIAPYLDPDNEMYNPSAVQIHEPSYTVTGLPEGISVENVMVTPVGLCGLTYVSQVIDGVKLTGSATPGEYNVTVRLQTYTLGNPGNGGNWIRAGAGTSRTATITFKLVVA